MESKEAQLLATMEKYQTEIMELENVVALGIGEKQRAKQSLNRLCIKVYVSQKVPEDQLSPDQVIPKSLNGFETDVEEMEPPEAL